MDDCNPFDVPAEPFSHLKRNQPPDSAKSQATHLPYREAIGSLMFASICTRPDISYAVGQVAKYSSQPNQTHWQAVKRILGYLKGTSAFGVSYGDVADKDRLVVYSDSDFAGDENDRCSTTGIVFMLNGGPISWSSVKQQCVSISTTEAEYVAASMAVQNTIWLRSLLKEIGIEQAVPTPLFSDNQSAIRLVRNSEFHQRSKHIDVKYHYIRKMQENKEINIQYVATEHQFTDVLTKAVNRNNFLKFRFSIGMCSFV